MSQTHSVPDGAFTDMGSVQASGGNRSFERPMHVFEVILEMKYEKSRKNNYGTVVRKGILDVLYAPATFADGKVVQVGGLPTLAEIPMAQPRIGEEVTDYFDMNKDYAKPALKLMLSRVFGVDPSIIDEKITLMSLDSMQPCFGIVMESRKTDRMNREKTRAHTRTEYLRRVPVAEIADKISDDAGAYLARIFKSTPAEAVAKMMESEAQLVAMLGGK